MGTQISLKLSDKMFRVSKNYANRKGYDNLQDFIRELIREKLFEEEHEEIKQSKTHTKKIKKFVY